MPFLESDGDVAEHQGQGHDDGDDGLAGHVAGDGGTYFLRAQDANGFVF